MKGQFSEIFVERAIQHLSQIGRSGDIYSEEHRDVLPKLQNLIKRNEFWSDRHWKPAYQELRTDKLIVLLKGYALVEAVHRLEKRLSGGSSVTPDVWMAVELKERDRDIADELKRWFEVTAGQAESERSKELVFNDYMIPRL